MSNIDLTLPTSSRPKQIQGRWQSTVAYPGLPFPTHSSFCAVFLQPIEQNTLLSYSTAPLTPSGTIAELRKCPEKPHLHGCQRWPRASFLHLFPYLHKDDQRNRPSRTKITCCTTKGFKQKIAERDEEGGSAAPLSQEPFCKPRSFPQVTYKEGDTHVCPHRWTSLTSEWCSSLWPHQFHQQNYCQVDEFHPKCQGTNDRVKVCSAS